MVKFFCFKEGSETLKNLLVALRANNYGAERNEVILDGLTKSVHGFQMSWNGPSQKDQPHFIYQREEAEFWENGVRNTLMTQPGVFQLRRVSPSLDKDKNMEILKALLVLRHRLEREKTAVESRDAFLAWVKKEEDYFYYLHPTVWNRDPAKGWGQQKIAHWAPADEERKECIVHFPLQQKDSVLTGMRGEPYKRGGQNCLITGVLVEKYTEEIGGITTTHLVVKSPEPGGIPSFLAERKYKSSGNFQKEEIIFENEGDVLLQKTPPKKKELLFLE